MKNTAVRLTGIVCAAAVCTSVLCSCSDSGVPVIPGNEPFPPDEPGYGVTVKKNADTSGMDFGFSEKDTLICGDAVTAEIVLSDSGSAVYGKGAEINGCGVTVTSAGVYAVSGNLSDGQITVSAGKDDKLTLIMNGVSVTNAAAPALFVKSADKVFIQLAEGTENYFSDGEGNEATDDSVNLDGAIFSRADITVKGNGSLTVNGRSAHGIVSKDGIAVTGGTLNVTAVKSGIEGKDFVKIGGGSIAVTAGSDGIRSTNDGDASCGYVFIADGDIDIKAGKDAVQAVTVLKLDGGRVNVRCGEGAPGGTGTEKRDRGFGYGYTASQNQTEDTVSEKGLKSDGDIIITGGTVNCDTADDCIHANGNIMISGGTLSLASGDDGIHADSGLTLSGGNVTVSESYEGFEASLVTISGGTHSITATDDGINGAGGSDGSSLGDRPGRGRFTSSYGKIIISGGYTVINACGDGIDSNGTVELSGGITLVSGPEDSGNTAFDHDGAASVTGGVLVALGSDGMAEGINSSENQGSIICSFTAQKGGTPFALCDADNNVIVSFTSAKSYENAVITAPSIHSGNVYRLVCGAVIEGADENGYAFSGTVTGGTVVAEIEMSSDIYGGRGFGEPGGRRGGFGEFGELDDPGMKRPDGEIPGEKPGERMPDGEMPGRQEMTSPNEKV